MRRMSKKAHNRYLESKPIRDSLRESVGACELCGSTYLLDVHEISRGVHRQKSLDKLFCLLLVCRNCHQHLGSAAKWPEARQLALLADKRLFDWDLQAYLLLTNPRAPRRIEVNEVAAYMENQILKVEEIAGMMRVNRRTVQTWIDSGELPAIYARPEGAQRALWRVKADDLLRFAQKRKSADAAAR